MYTITVMNPKGGCGKSTLAVNVAGLFALSDKKVSLLDLDPQGSSRFWLKRRPADRAVIYSTERRSNVPADTEVLVVDTPAGTSTRLLKNASETDALLVPILPSPIDIDAACNFITLLKGSKRVRNGQVRVGTVANRAREDTVASAKLEAYLGAVQIGGRRVPMITMLRPTHNYVYAAERGLTIFEMSPSKCYYDQEQWQPLYNWLRRHG